MILLDEYNAQKEKSYCRKRTDKKNSDADESGARRDKESNDRRRYNNLRNIRKIAGEDLNLFVVQSHKKYSNDTLKIAYALFLSNA